MRKADGYAYTFDQQTGQTLVERDTFRCNHCSKQVHIKPFCDPADLGGYCTLCNDHLCKHCNYLRSLGKPCVPFEKRMALLETHMERGNPFRDPDTFSGND